MSHQSPQRARKKKKERDFLLCSEQKLWQYCSTLMPKHEQERTKKRGKDENTDMKRYKEREKLKKAINIYRLQ